MTKGTEMIPANQQKTKDKEKLIEGCASLLSESGILRI